MSHTLRKVNLGNTALCESTIIDYTQGGEAYTLTELGLTGSVTDVIFLAADASSNTPGLVLTPLLISGKIVLQYRPGVEIPTTTGLNYTFVAIVNGT